MINNNNYQHKLPLQNKLNNLYKGHLLLPNNTSKYIKLYDFELTQP